MFSRNPPDVELFSRTVNALRKEETYGVTGTLLLMLTNQLIIVHCFPQDGTFHFRCLNISRKTKDFILTQRHEATKRKL